MLSGKKFRPTKSLLRFSLKYGFEKFIGMLYHELTVSVS